MKKTILIALCALSINGCASTELAEPNMKIFKQENKCSKFLKIADSYLEQSIELETTSWVKASAASALKASAFLERYKICSKNNK